jgi:hypothetical protein
MGVRASQVALKSAGSGLTCPYGRNSRFAVFSPGFTSMDFSSEFTPKNSCPSFLLIVLVSIARRLSPFAPRPQAVFA